MAENILAKESEQHPAIRNYSYLCMAALAIILFVLLQQRIGLVSLLPVLVGLLGVTFRWRFAPLFLLALVAGVVYWNETRPLRGFQPLPLAARTFSLRDWILCGAVLAYFAAQHRLQSLTGAVFPVDDRWSPASSGAGAANSSEAIKVQQPRTASLVSASEIGWLVLSVPVWAFLAQLGTKLLPARWETYQLLIWIASVGFFTAAGLLSYARWLHLTPREAKLILQDAVWQETRREQRRLSRSLSWAKIRRRKERP